MDTNMQFLMPLLKNKLQICMPPNKIYLKSLYLERSILQSATISLSNSNWFVDLSNMSSTTTLQNLANLRHFTYPNYINKTYLKVYIWKEASYDLL